MKPKKQITKADYRKGTEMTRKNEVIDRVNKSTVIYIKEQVAYNDDSQSMTIEIHWPPDT